MRIGDVDLQYLGHSGFIISNGRRIAVDPYNVPQNVEPADLILITHEHSDHCSIKDIQKLAQKGTIVLGPAHVQSAVMKVQGVHVQPIEVGDSLEFGDIKVEAVRAYNVNKYRDAGKKTHFHPKNEGYVGYVVKYGNTVIYHTGDSDLIPEMKKLTGYGKHGNTFVALLPVSGTYVMDVDEAVEAAELLSPHLVIPMHYGAGVVGTREDAERFVTLCNDKGIHAQILEKI